jgi:hypothetical protein
MEEIVQITQGEYRTLLAAKEFLNCLEACGVVKWEGYSIACSIYGNKEATND